MKKYFVVLAAILIMVITGCGHSDDPAPPKTIEKSSEKAITALFVIESGGDSSHVFVKPGTEKIMEATIDETAKTIAINIPSEWLTYNDFNNFPSKCVRIHEYTITGQCLTIVPESTCLLSRIGVTYKFCCKEPQNFCTDDIYVRAEDGTSQKYIVKTAFNVDSGGGDSGGNSGTDPGSKGDVSITLTWSWSNSTRTEGPDIDMWVTDPNGHTLSTSRNDYSLGPCPDGGQIDYDDLGGWGDGNGGGPERAFWPTGSAPSGTYTYGVRYYQGDGTAKYTLKVYKGTTLYTTKTGTLTEMGSAITLGTITK